MKRSFLVLILMFIASPAASAEQASCPCFNDLQIAGTCSRASNVTSQEYQTPPGSQLTCDANPATPNSTQWIFAALEWPPNGPLCYVDMYFRDREEPGFAPSPIRIRSIWITQDQFDDCVGQIISAYEMLN